MIEQHLRDILRRLGVTVTERSASGWLQARCPLAPYTHRGGRDHRPSFGAKVEDGGNSAYACFSCHAHGRISSLVRTLWHHGHDVGAIDSNNYPELAREADRYDALGAVEQPFIIPPEEYDPPPVPLDPDLYEGIYEEAWRNGDAMGYLASRGVGLVTTVALGLLYDPDQRRVLFPVRDRDFNIYGWTGRAIDANRQPKVRDYLGLPKRHLILGEHLWSDDENRPLVIVEGLFGLAHLVELNLLAYANIGALMGSVMTEQKAERIANNDAPTYLLFDGDAAGDAGLFGRVSATGDRDAATGAVSLLREHVPLHVPAWPEGKDDPDQLTRAEVWGMLRDTPQISVANNRDPVILPGAVAPVGRSF